MRTERDELLANPEEERQELQLIYEAKGLKPEEAAALSAKLLRPRGGGRRAGPRGAGHSIPPSSVARPGWPPAPPCCSSRSARPSPCCLSSSSPARPPSLTSLAAGGAGLCFIGAAIAVFTGRSALYSAARQLLLGLLAAGATFGIGKLIGVALAG